MRARNTVTIALAGSALAALAVLGWCAGPAAAASAPVLSGVSAGTTVSGTLDLRATVAGAPGRVEIGVDGKLRRAFDKSPYAYRWHTRAEANGTHSVTVRAFGPGDATPAVTRITVMVSNKTAYPAPLPFGKESMYAEFNQGDAATAANLLDDVWPARGHPLPRLGWPLTWKEDPYGDAYWRFYHYSLRPLSSLLYQWQTTRQAAYRDKLVAILRSFAAYDAKRPYDRLTFDNPHAGAYRTMTLVNFFMKLKRGGALPADLEKSLRAALQRLGAFLAEPRNFEGTHNHGFNEGAALLLLAHAFPEMAQAAAWRQLAVQRLQAMLRATVDGDGVEVENSPFYHVYVLGLVAQIADWAKLHEPGLAPAYTAAKARMLRYAAYVTQPSGYLPMLGATATTYLPSQDPTVYGPMADTDPEFAFAYTRGARGTAPPAGAWLFPESGLYLLRSPLASAAQLANQTFVTFDAGTYRTEHSDLDALSVTMYANGSTVLPESGLFTYTAQPDRAYFHGTRAHNTVTVDGEDQPEGHARPRGKGGTNGVAWATGTSDLYAGVAHRRSVVLLAQALVLVVDRLASAAAHDYTQHWHLPPDARTSVAGRDVVAQDAAGRPVLAIRQADPAGLALASARGATAPMQGWYSAAYGAKTPAWALAYTRRASTTTFATLLAAGPHAGQRATVTRRAATGGGSTVDVCVAGTPGYAVTVPAGDGAIGVRPGGVGCPAG
jgi:hypothetical protein